MTGKAGKGAGAALVAALALSGCMSGRGGEAEVARAADGLGAPPVLDAALENGTTSVLIETLLNRRSVLGEGPLRQVAEAVMAANTRAAEADLRAARLRAEAQSMNWLPQLGPQVSVTSLSSVLASLVVSQALFDNGRARAERDHAAADVEVAAVSLAIDSNERVETGLDLYLDAQAARARAEVSARGVERLEHFAYVMTERVNAGVSDRADLQVVVQRLDQMRADLAADREAESAAIAELQAMAAGSVATVRGLSAVGSPQPAIEALAVMRARADGARAVAAARAARAGFLPGVTLGGTITGEGSDGGLTVAAPNGFGFGNRAAIAAAEAEGAAVEARVGQEQEAAARVLAALEGRREALRRQADEARTLARAAAANYETFAAQQRAGQRTVPETVSVFETLIRAERHAADLAHEVVRIEVRIAAHLGVLVDGERL